MTSVFLREESQACRACGSTAAPWRAAAMGNVCDWCWKEFSRFNKDTGLTALAFNKWLANRLYVNARRKQNYGVTGRCEAITQQGAAWSGGHKGLQCRGLAVLMRDGRRVCAQHKRSISNQYVGEKNDEPYRVMAGMIEHLATADGEFLSHIEAAIDAAKAKRSEARRENNGDGFYSRRGHSPKMKA